MSEPRRILFVEDDKQMQGLYARVLKEEGYQVVTAATGEEAMEIAQAGERFDLVLTDFELGSGMNGVVLARQIRSFYGEPMIPVWLHCSTAAARKDLDTNDDIEHVIEKPSKREQIVGALNEKFKPQEETQETP